MNGYHKDAQQVINQSCVSTTLHEVKPPDK